MAQLDQSTTDLFCPDCGYNLRGITSDCCPECGTEFDRSALAESIIPWVHRQKLGKFKAFWKTVNMATFRTRFFAREIIMPARFGDAVKFRRRVVMHGLVPLGLASTALYLMALHEGLGPSGGFVSSRDIPGSILQIVGIPVIWLCLAMFLFAATGVASYFFHPRALPVVQQNRAVALSYYACAPMAYAPITIVCMILGGVLGGVLVNARASPLLTGVIFVVAFAPVAAQIAAMIRNSVILLTATTHTGMPQRWVLGLFLPVAWVLLGFVLLFLVPAAYLMIALMIVSFRQ